MTLWRSLLESNDKKRDSSLQRALRHPTRTHNRLPADKARCSLDNLAPVSRPSLALRDLIAAPALLDTFFLSLACRHSPARGNKKTTTDRRRAGDLSRRQLICHAVGLRRLWRVRRLARALSGCSRREHIRREVPSEERGSAELIGDKQQRTVGRRTVGRSMETGRSGVTGRLLVAIRRRVATAHAYLQNNTRSIKTTSMSHCHST